MATITTPPAGMADAGHPSGLSEPSMEDILASIRRIIAEDQSSGAGRSGLGGFARRTAPADAAEPPMPAPSIEVAPIEPVPAAEAGLGEASRASHDAEPAGYVPGTPPELVAIHVEPPAPATSAAFSPPADAAGMVEDWSADAPLISAAAGASIQSSFHALAESMVMQDPAIIERAVRDALRPMLKEWLDDNLPGLVERLVRAEIERVARGGSGRD